MLGSVLVGASRCVPRGMFISLSSYFDYLWRLGRDWGGEQDSDTAHGVKDDLQGGSLVHNQFWNTIYAFK